MVDTPAPQSEPPDAKAATIDNAILDEITDRVDLGDILPKEVDLDEEETAVMTKDEIRRALGREPPKA